ncbi:MAG: DUF2130 domain-containing protein [Patescibacteria group bacterium]
MDKIICNNCGKEVDIDKVVLHQLREQVSKEQAEKNKAELEKAKAQFEKEKADEIAFGIKKALQDTELKNKEKGDELRKRKEENVELEKRLAKIEKDKKASEEKARKDEAEKFRLDRLAYEKRISDMQKSLDEAKRKGNQGSQQAQGDVLEIDLKKKLTETFTYDTIKDIPTGVRGADIIQEVRNKFGKTAGIILWETKRQKAWNKNWLAKLKEDMRKISASDCILVSDILPSTVKSYDRLDNVWVTSYEYAIKLSTVLRIGILNVAIARAGASHTDDNLRRFYAIVNSDKFRHTLEARKEIIAVMEKDLEADKTSTDRKWRRQEAIIEKLKSNHRDLYGMLEDHIPSLKSLSDSDMFELESGESEEDKEQSLF